MLRRTPAHPHHPADVDTFCESVSSSIARLQCPTRRPILNAPSPRRAAHRPRQERIEDILRAARAVFSEKGYEAAAMAEIAARVGVSEATVYKYFESKRALLLSVIRQWFETMIAENRERLAGIDGVQARVKVLIWQHLKTIRDASDLCRLFYSEVRSRPDYVGSDLHALNRDATRLLTEEIERGVASGELRPGVPPRLVRDLVYGGIEHHVAAFLAGRGTLDCDSLAAALTALVFDGLLPVAAADPLSRTAARLERVAARLEGALGPRTLQRTPR